MKRKDFFAVLIRLAEPTLRFLNFNALCFVIHHSNRGISIVPKVPFFLTNGFSRNVPVWNVAGHVLTLMIISMASYVGISAESYNGARLSQQCFYRFIV